jgi:hypothetical protein
MKEYPEYHDMPMQCRDRNVISVEVGTFVSAVSEHEDRWDTAVVVWIVS